MPFNTTNETLDHVEDYEGKELIGTVTANTDPLNIGRLQVSVPDLYDNEAGEVPWVGRRHDSPYGYGTNSKGQYGWYGYPQIGCKVRVSLQHGDEHYPLYEPMQVAPDANSQFANPLVWGFKDPDGNIMIYDMEAHTYRMITAGGAQIEIDANGKRITQVNGDVETSNGDWTVNVTGNASITASGNASVHASGSISIQAGGAATYKASVHQFQGPVVTDSTVAAAGDITDLTGQGNTKTVGNMRTVYDNHDHNYTDDGNQMVTAKPNQPI
jgi:hypothetical protein